MDKKLKIAIDFDCTLYYHDYEDPTPIDKMDIIPCMKVKVLNWLEQGHEVVCFTARANSAEQVKKIRKKLDEDGLKGIKKVTNIKDSFDYIVDDKAIHVEPNKGEMHGDPITQSPEAEIGRMGHM